MSVDFEFTLFKKHGKFTIIDNKLAKQPENFGVYLSGGIDSVALLCLILAERKSLNLDTPVTAFTIDKSDGPTYHAVNVLNKIREHFNVEIEHINDIPNDLDADKKGNIGVECMKYIHGLKPDMLLYMGINRMAPDDIRPFKERLIVDYGYEQVTRFYRAPFLFLHKPQILDILYKLNCEDIIPYTHSCTVLKDGMCGECYSCKEREWGFSALGKVDPAHQAGNTH